MQPHFHKIYLQLANMGGSVGQFSHPSCMGAIQDGKFLKWQQFGRNDTDNQTAQALNDIGVDQIRI